MRDYEEELLDRNAYFDWIKSLPNHEVEGFADTVNAKFPIDFQIEEDNPRMWAEIAYSFAESPEELDSIVRTVDKACKEFS